MWVIVDGSGQSKENQIYSEENHELETKNNCELKTNKSTEGNNLQVWGS